MGCIRCISEWPSRRRSHAIDEPPPLGQGSVGDAGNVGFLRTMGGWPDGLSLVVSMVTLERHNGVPTLERGNDQMYRNIGDNVKVVGVASPTGRGP